MSDTDKDKIIAVLRAEVLAWRHADTWHELTDYMDETEDHSHSWDVKKAMEQTNAANALEES